MAVEIVTIVNQSGKIIGNGKHILNVLKEAKATYQEKKAAIKAERAVQRSATYDIPTVPRYDDDVQYIGYGEYDRRASYDDAASRATSRRSHRSKAGRGSRYRSASQTGTALTESNLERLTEVSSTAPSRPPVAYRSPYAETVTRDMTLSRPTLAHAPTMPIHEEEQSVATEQYPPPVYRSRSDPELKEKGGKQIDMNLAYGNIPPDLADRVDLDPAYKAEQKERKAQSLIEKIESLLMEAQCLHHTAQHIIQHLQNNPDAAAAVALALAELSALLGKMSPSFLGVLKGGSPAIFALLASPQFLIAAGVTVGVTVVMFGGWKIVKRVREQQATTAIQPMAFEARPQAYTAAPQTEVGPDRPPYPATEYSGGSFDEALVLEEELSSIETWRRGIVPFGEDETADLELISPEANRAMRGQNGGDDACTERSVRTTRTHKTAKTSKTHKSHKSHKSHWAVGGGRENDAPDAASEAGSHRSHRSQRSHRSERTERSSHSKRTNRVSIKAIEDGSKDKENSINMVIRPKKDNMLKSLFKKKKNDQESKVLSELR
ncbi:hypothetical protein F4779DRAFT_95074 [Xylariaceae sp. FL0662B]|nr:hypothetical protein F4779DRAFT_95074 [Xylariaceae sp. FL0662B]